MLYVLYRRDFSGVSYWQYSVVASVVTMLHTLVSYYFRISTLLLFIVFHSRIFAHLLIMRFRMSGL